MIWEPHRFRLRNLKESENKAHSREEARERGFGGSIVGGAMVYGRMIQPVIERLGLEWLTRSRLDIRFKSPAYDDDLLEVSIEEQDSSLRLRTFNEEGTELLEMTTHLVAEAPPLDPRASSEPIDWQGERVEGTWERFVLDQPFRTFHWALALDEQIAYCDATDDRLPIYRNTSTPPAHPGLVMAQGSHMVANQFVMPFWIHASSTLLHRRAIRVGDNVQTRCVPYEKWRKGANEWVKFYQLYLVDEEPAIEVWKTSVIKVAARR